MHGTPSRYWHTLKHLKAIQILARLKAVIHRPKLQSLSEVPALRIRLGRWTEPARRKPSMVSPDSFQFLGKSHTISCKTEWNDISTDKLWLYNLHYFDDLNAHDHSDRTVWHHTIIDRWIIENPPVEGNGWEAYPLSLRICNWVKWVAGGASPTPVMLMSLFNQTRWLQKRLEWHLLGNHLFANAKALVLAGLFFEGKEAERWLRNGLRIVEDQIAEQILEDGGNFERSPMYHAIFLEDVLDLLNASRAWPNLIGAQMSQLFQDTAQKMLDFLLGMTHPDGQISHFNDSALEIAPAVNELQLYAAKLDILPSSSFSRLRHWPDSGYIRLHSQNASALLDVAPIGPDYLPGHAHADTLSFELAIFGRRLVINGGTSCYGLSQIRHFERSTISHSTVQIGGQNSSDVWASFRVGRRAYPFGLQLEEENDMLEVSCSHNGYAHLPERPVHTRKWQLGEDCFIVTDNVSDSGLHAIARFIIHPDATVSQSGNNGYNIVWEDGKDVQLVVLTGDPSLEASYYSPKFGERCDTVCIAVKLIDGKSQIRLEWQ